MRNSSNYTHTHTHTHIYFPSLLSFFFPPKKYLRLLLRGSVTNSLLRETQWFFLSLVNVFPTHFYPGGTSRVSVCVFREVRGESGPFLMTSPEILWESLCCSYSPGHGWLYSSIDLERCSLPLGPDVHVTYKEIWCALSLGCVWLFVTPWTIARLAPVSVGLTRQEYRSGLPFPFPGNQVEPGIKPRLVRINCIAQRTLLNVLWWPRWKEIPQKRGYIYIYIADSLCCRVEMNTTLMHTHTKSLSRVWLSVTPWTVAHQAPLSMGFSRQEYWSG